MTARAANVVPTVYRAPIRQLMAGDWVGPVAASGHALHFVAHPLMPPLQVSIGAPQSVGAQPQNDGALNYIRDTVRGFYRLAPGGTLVSRVPLADVYVRVDVQDRSNGDSWTRPGLMPYLKTTKRDGAGAAYVDYMPANVGMLANELHGDDVVLISGEGDLFPRDVRPELPAHLVLPALLAYVSGTAYGVTDTAQSTINSNDINLARLSDVVPRAVWSRYRRVRLMIQSFFSTPHAVAPWAGDSSLPVVQLPLRRGDQEVAKDEWAMFAFGSWAPDYRAEMVLNCGTPDEYAAANTDAGFQPRGRISSPAPAGAAAPIRQTVARYILDNGEPEAGEIEYARAYLDPNNGGVATVSYWTALPVSRKANRVGIASSLLPASSWYVQLATYLNLGWGFGDQLYTRALTAIDYDSVLLGAGVGALSDVDETIVGGVSIGINGGINALTGKIGIAVGP